MQITVELKKAERSDFSWVTKSGSIQTRYGFVYWIKPKAGVELLRRVFKDTTDSKSLASLIDRGKVYIMAPTHPDNNLPGIETKSADKKKHNLEF